MTKREFYKSIGICPNCRKRKIIANENSCHECKRLRNEYEKKRHKEKHEQINEYQRSLARKIKERRIENGECSRCGKKLTDEDTDMGYKNYKMCIACRQYYQIRRKGK